MPEQDIPSRIVFMQISFLMECSRCTGNSTQNFFLTGEITSHQIDIRIRAFRLQTDIIAACEKQSVTLGIIGYWSRTSDSFPTEHFGILERTLCFRRTEHSVCDTVYQVGNTEGLDYDFRSVPVHFTQFVASFINHRSTIVFKQSRQGFYITRQCAKARIDINFTRMKQTVNTV